MLKYIAFYYLNITDPKWFNDKISDSYFNIFWYIFITWLANLVGLKPLMLLEEVIHISILKWLLLCVVLHSYSTFVEIYLSRNFWHVFDIWIIFMQIFSKSITRIKQIFEKVFVCYSKCHNKYSDFDFNVLQTN